MIIDHSPTSAPAPPARVWVKSESRNRAECSQASMGADALCQTVDFTEDVFGSAGQIEGGHLDGLAGMVDPVITRNVLASGVDEQS